MSRGGANGGDEQKISPELIQMKSEEYKENYPEEEKILSEMPAKFEQGTWDKEDIDWIVVEWKLERFPDSFSTFPQNDIDDIRPAVDKCLKSNTIRGKIEAFTNDTNISGVGVSVATAILVFMEPDRFTLIDKFAWKALRSFGYLNEPYASPNIDQYLIYLGTCRTLAYEYDVDLRDLDRALWMTGREQ